MILIRQFKIFLFLAVALITLTACSRDLNDIIENEPCVQGVVESVQDESITIRVNEDDPAAASSDLISVSLDVESKDSITIFYEGDQVAVYYDGAIAESYPAQIHTVYAIVLTQGGQAREEVENSLSANDDGYYQISPEDAKAMMEENEDAIILDVREQDEYDESHIPGAVLLPVGTIDADTAEAVIASKDTTVLVYCRSGNRSKTASAALAELGYTQIYEFGGIQDWPYEVES